MSSKLVQAVRQKKLRSRSKSKDKNTNAKTKAKDKNKEIALNVLQTTIQIVYPSEKINTLLNGFVKQIDNPILLYTEIYESKSPQKCLQHNNIETLYCINDQRLLCAGCMYHSPIHKGHKVVPLNNNTDDAIKLNLKNGIYRIQQHLKICSKVIQKASQNIQKAQKEYPLLMQQINTFYMDFHQLLVDRRNQQLKLVSELWSKLRYQNSTMKMEMARISSYVKGKLNETKNRTSSDSLIFNKNIIDTLCNAQNIIKEETIQVEENPYFKEFKKLQTVYQFVKEQLTLYQVKTKKIQSYYKSPKSPKNKGQNLMKKNSMLQAKSPRKQKQNERTVQEKLIEIHERQLGIERIQVVIPKNIKNRHSKSEVLLKNQVQIRKKQFQKQQAKKQFSSIQSPTNTTSKQQKKSPDKKEPTKSPLKKK